jgi:hypothetical protein
MPQKAKKKPRAHSPEVSAAVAVSSSAKAVAMSAHPDTMEDDLLTETADRADLKDLNARLHQVLLLRQQRASLIESERTTWLREREELTSKLQREQDTARHALDHVTRERDKALENLVLRTEGEDRGTRRIRDLEEQLTHFKAISSKAVRVDW